MKARQNAERQRPGGLREAHLVDHQQVLILEHHVQRDVLHSCQYSKSGAAWRPPCHSPPYRARAQTIHAVPSRQPIPAPWSRVAHKCIRDPTERNRSAIRDICEGLLLRVCARFLPPPTAVQILIHACTFAASCERLPAALRLPVEPPATVERYRAGWEPVGVLPSGAFSGMLRLRTSGAAEVVGGGGRVHRTKSPALTLVCFCTCARSRSISGANAGSAPD